ncbi:MAG: hypothetical protein IJX18_03410, partial [Clostridia bacterium]|nr:hypothetical protein [Clostridia bacterium]
MKKKLWIGLLSAICALTMVGATACGGGGDPGDPGNGPGSEQTQKYDVTLRKNIMTAGSLSGGGEYDENSSVTVTATTNSGYTF